MVAEPLAGSKKLHGEFSAKDVSEHLMLVDLLRNDLSMVCQPGSVAVEEFMACAPAGLVSHLSSRLRGEISAAFDIWDVVKAVSPAGTMIGAPKFSAWNLLNYWEPVPRGFYSGCFGIASESGAIRCALVIRSLFRSRGLLRVNAGGGIVADSQVDSEWREVELKMGAALDAFGMGAWGGDE